MQGNILCYNYVIKIDLPFKKTTTAPDQSEDATLNVLD